MSNFCLNNKENIDFISKAFNILSEPNRIKILCLLEKDKEICVCEIVASLDLKQNLVSHHLSMFKKIWLVETTRKSTNIYYKINEEKYTKLKNIIWEIFILKDT